MAAQDSSDGGTVSNDHSNTDTRDQNGAIEPPTKKRRVFLQTMGQQLRGIGIGNKTVNGATVDTLPDSASAMTSNSSGHELRSSRQVHIQTPESDAVPGEDDQVSTMPPSANKALWRPCEVVVSSDLHENNDFDFDDLLDWTHSYFEYWHSPFPFLHAPTVLEYFNKMADPHSGLSAHELTIVRAVASISLADRRQTGVMLKPLPQHLVFTSLNDAIQSAQSLLFEESTVLALQAIVSVQLFLISMLRYNAASRLEGLASRMAFHLGLHRCPRQSQIFSTKDAELRQRLFWSMYSIDRFICIRLGIPLGIRDADVDTCFPTQEQHGSVAEGAQGELLPLSHFYGVADIADYDGKLDLLELLARHTKIRGCITELRNRSLAHKSTEHDEAITIEAEMTKWWNDVDELLEPDDPTISAVSDYHRLVLIVSRYEAVIALNKHILATTKNSAAYNSALQNCITAARAIITTIHKAIDTGGCQDGHNGERPEGDVSIGLMWPSFTWAIWMSTFLVIYAANEDQVKYDIAIRYVELSTVTILGPLTRTGLRISRSWYSIDLLNELVYGQKHVLWRYKI